MSSSRPNILVLMSDQHSKHFLGSYGNPLVRTPNLDRLAEAGMRFQNAYCAAPLCVPSRMAFMTGRRPTANRVWTNSHILSSAIPTWAHALGAAGYETALIGRMHFVGADHRHGFELRPIGEASATFPGASRLGVPQFVRVPGATSGQTRISVEMAGVGRNCYQGYDERIAAAACTYLRERAANGDGRPFAAVAGFVLPHCPFFAPRELFDYYYDRVDVPEFSVDEPEAVHAFRRHRDIETPLPPERVRVARAAYCGMCEYLDRQVGRVLKALEESGLAENTLVIYCSDHGEMAGEHGCWWKSNYFEGSVGVPLIARMPGTVPAGTVNERVCSLMDCAPTFSEIANAENLPRQDGHSLWTELQGTRDLTRVDEAFSEHGPARNDPASRMIRRDAWKLYQYGDELPPVLYNLSADPEETRDLNADPDSRPKRDELLSRLRADWDPADVAEQNQALLDDLAALSAWGRAVQPRHEDALVVVDQEDIEFR